MYCRLKLNKYYLTWVYFEHIVDIISLTITDIVIIFSQRRTSFHFIANDRFAKQNTVIDYLN